MYRAAVVGCGRIGVGFSRDARRDLHSTHAGSYLICNATELVAVADIGRGQLELASETLGSGVNYYQSVGEMLEEEGPDIVSICTPPCEHLSVVFDCLLCGGAKAIYCEKPLAETIEDAEEIVRLCKEKEVLLVVNHQRRFSLLHRWISLWIDAGGLGRIQQGAAQYCAGLMNSGTHLVDLLRMYLGSVECVGAVYSPCPSGKKDDRNLDGTIRFVSGPTIRLQALDVDHYSEFGFQLWGEMGYLETTTGGLGLNYKVAKESERFAGYRELYHATLPLPVGQEEHKLIPLGVQHIVDCLETGNAPISSGEDALATLKVLFALMESAREGRIVCLS